MIRPLTDKMLDAWRKSDWKKIAGRWEAPIRQMIDELTSLRLYVRVIEAAYLRERAQRIELDRQTKPGGRVLVVDCPPGDGERCEGETVVYADGLIDLYTTRCPVGVSHPRFDAVLEAVLFESPRRFQGMPGELPIRVRSLTRYPRDFRKEVESLVNAKLAGNVLAALNELRAGMEATDEAEPAQTQVQEASSPRARTPGPPPIVSF